MAPVNLCSHQCPYFDIWGTTRPLTWSQGCGKTGICPSFLRKLADCRVSVGSQTNISDTRCDTGARGPTLLDGTAHSRKVIDPLVEKEAVVDLTNLNGQEVGILDMTVTDGVNNNNDTMPKSRTKESARREGGGRTGARSEETIEEEVSSEVSLELGGPRRNNIEYVF